MNQTISSTQFYTIPQAQISSRKERQLWTVRLATDRYVGLLPDYLRFLYTRDNKIYLILLKELQGVLLLIYRYLSIW